jgi:hypothetical protein
VQVYTVCGKIAIFWGPVELGIEGLLVRVRNYRGLGNTPFPISFRKKVASLKKLMRDEPALIPVLDHVRPLLGRAAELHHLRGWVVHSLCQGTDLDGGVVFGTSNQKIGYAYVSKVMTMAELEGAAAELRTMREAMDAAYLMLRNAEEQSGRFGARAPEPPSRRSPPTPE